MASASVPQWLPFRAGPADKVGVGLHAFFAVGLLVASATAAEPPPPNPIEPVRACYVARMTEAARVLLPELSEGPLRIRKISNSGPLEAISAGLNGQGIRSRPVRVELGADASLGGFQGIQLEKLPPGALPTSNLSVLLEKLNRKRFPLVISPNIPPGKARVIVSRAFDQTSAAVVLLPPDLALGRGDVGEIFQKLTDLVLAPEGFVESMNYLEERTVRRAAGLGNDDKVSERKKKNVRGAMLTQLEINVQTEAGNRSNLAFVDPAFWRERPLRGALKREFLRSLDSMNSLTDVRWKNAKFRFFTRKSDSDTYAILIAHGFVWAFNSWVVIKFLLSEDPKKRRPTPGPPGYVPQEPTDPSSPPAEDNGADHH